MFQHLERMRNKPDHIRKGVAFGAAGALTLLVALGWGVFTVESGSLALAPTVLTPDATAQIATTASETSSGFSNLLGAVGAATSADTKPSLQIVDSGVTSTINAKAAATPAPEQTTIPF